MGKPLPNRETIVISNTSRYEGESLKTVTSLEEALKSVLDKDIYISGGSRLYEEAIQFVDKMYVTVIEKEFEGIDFF
ncbi:dihydrofolate reductase [Clostridium paraputrificum]|uniref:dihydrofolate reductase n=1 Tax=Clostridium paraputrificum TaxID=29363 RepID=UPI003D34ABD2